MTPLVCGWKVGSPANRGWRIDVLAHSLNQLRPELFDGKTLLVWCGENQTLAQQQQLSAWRAQGRDIHPLGA
ncbi:transcriptional regulator [Salmonella enterica subsp. arizonae]|uniref:Transcriptional regulator n=1 Tax=Salmonella enterica subsp. arizonae TaxID=59203 RepID=A0A379TA08_SALER|nr:transcriptional regulator [Salmonella enterica subsp. arizonae]